jgi:hypothetical protein
MAIALGITIVLAWLRRKAALRARLSRASARAIDRHSTF